MKFLKRNTHTQGILVYVVLMASIVFFVPFFARASVSSFSFSVAPSVLAVNDASCKFTVTANENIPETFDIFLSSTGSGEFSSSGTNWVSVTKVTMSTGTANRSFYYKGTTSGSVTITATAKPRSGTGEFPAKTTVVIGGSSDCDGGQISDTDDVDEETDDTDNGASTEKATEVILVEPDPVYTASMIVPTTVVRGIPARFESLIQKEIGSETFTKLSGRYEWSMGDGAEYRFEKNTPINHVYTYTGDYTVVFRYYSNDFKEKPDSIHRKTITVLSDSVTIARVMSDGGIVLRNNSGKELDLGGWVLESYGRTYTVPMYTYVDSGKELMIAPGIHQIATVGGISLQNNQRHEVFAYTVSSATPIPGIGDARAITSPYPKKVSTFASTQTTSLLATPQTAEASDVVSENISTQSAFSAPRFNLPIGAFIILVITAIIGYTVYIYGRRRNLRKNEGTGVGTLADEFDIEDVIKNP